MSGPNRKGKNPQRAKALPPQQDSEPRSLVPHGADVLRRLHEDDGILLRDYDAAYPLIDQPDVKAHLHERMADIDRRMSVAESLWDRHYTDFGAITDGMGPALDGDMADAPDADPEADPDADAGAGMESGVEGGESPQEEMADLTAAEEHANEVGSEQAQAVRGGNQTQADSNPGDDALVEREEPTPEDAVEAMRRKPGMKRLSGQKSQEELVGRCADCGRALCICDQLRDRATGRSLIDDGNVGAMVLTGQETKDGMLDLDALEKASLKGYAAGACGYAREQRKSLLTEMAVFLKDLAEAPRLDSTARMKAYHLAQTAKAAPTERELDLAEQAGGDFATRHYAIRNSEWHKAMPRKDERDSAYYAGQQARRDPDIFTPACDETLVNEEYYRDAWDHEAADRLNDDFRAGYDRKAAPADPVDDFAEDFSEDDLLEDCAAYFDALSQEKAFGLVHRERAKALASALTKAVPQVKVERKAATTTGAPVAASDALLGLKMADADDLYAGESHDKAGGYDPVGRNAEGDAQSIGRHARYGYYRQGVPTEQYRRHHRIIIGDNVSPQDKEILEREFDQGWSNDEERETGTPGYPPRESKACAIPDRRTPLETPWQEHAEKAIEDSGPGHKLTHERPGGDGAFKDELDAAYTTGHVRGTAERRGEDDIAPDEDTDLAWHRAIGALPGNDVTPRSREEAWQAHDRGVVNAHNRRKSLDDLNRELEAFAS